MQTTLLFFLFQLHHILTDYTFLAELVYKRCVSHNRCASHTLLLWHRNWSSTSFIRVHTGRHYLAATYFQVTYWYKFWNGKGFSTNIYDNAIRLWHFVYHYYSTDALTFESVALLVIFAILSLLPGIYRNRLSIKNNIKRAKACVEKCCCPSYGDNIDAVETTTQPSEAESTGCRATNDNTIDPCQRTNT